MIDAKFPYHHKLSSLTPNFVIIIIIILIIMSCIYTDDKASIKQQIQVIKINIIYKILAQYKSYTPIYTKTVTNKRTKFNN